MKNVNAIERMKELNETLTKAANAYYNADEIMSDKEYDTLYDELVSLEKETGIILSGSRTQKVGYEVVSNLPKVKHPKKMLSLDKTKDREALKSWLGDKKGFLSWKLDGLTLVLTYKGGELVKAVTRGDGEVGEDIITNARHIKGVPSRIPFTGELTVRGEAIMKYADFNAVNNGLAAGEKPYKNPRNLCVGTVRNLDSKYTAERNINFFAFNLVSAEGESENSFVKRLEWLKNLGIQKVFGLEVTADNIIEAVEYFEKEIANNEFPSDGLVLTFDDVEYGLSLGETSHHPRNGIAFKWNDETAETTLREVEWSASRTGLLNPVAIFDTVDLEGTDVSRASVHNVSIVKELALGIGDTLEVYKANMIIPQVLRNKTKTGTLAIPTVCPVCGGKTEIKVSDDGIETLYCTNVDCSAKNIGKFEHFVQRDAMNVVGMSSATIEMLVSEGMVKTYRDFYHLTDYKDDIISRDGFGEKSFAKMIAAIEKSREVELDRVLYGLGITNIGRSASKDIVAALGTPENLISATVDQLTAIDGIGGVLAQEYVNYFAKQENVDEFNNLLAELNIKEQAKVDTSSGIAGKTFVVTGSVNIWKSRNELKAYIESNGAKVASAVSAKTDYLINNDSTSSSSKNKKAKELGVAIITEEEFKALAE